MARVAPDSASDPHWHMKYVQSNKIRFSGLLAMFACWRVDYSKLALLGWSLRYLSKSSVVVFSRGSPLFLRIAKVIILYIFRTPQTSTPCLHVHLSVRKWILSTHQWQTPVRVSLYKSRQYKVRTYLQRRSRKHEQLHHWLNPWCLQQEQAIPAISCLLGAGNIKNAFLCTNLFLQSEVHQIAKHNFVT